MSNAPGPTAADLATGSGSDIGLDADLSLSSADFEPIDADAPDEIQLEPHGEADDEDGGAPAPPKAKARPAPKKAPPPRREDPPAEGEDDPKDKAREERDALLAAEERRAAEKRAERRRAERARIEEQARRDERARYEPELRRARSEADLAMAKAAALSRGTVEERIAALRAIGLDTKDLLKAEIEASSPDALAKAALARAEAVEKKLAQKEAEEEARRIEAEEQRELSEGQARFLSWVDDRAELYPHLAQEPDSWIARKSAQLARGHKAETGSYPPKKLVAEFMDRLCKKHQEERAAKLAKKKPASDAETVQLPPSGQRTASPGSRTLANPKVAERATSPREKTEEEIDEELRQFANAQNAAARAARRRSG